MPILNTLKKFLGNNYDFFASHLLYEDGNDCPQYATKEAQEVALKAFLKRYCNSGNLPKLQSALIAKTANSDCVLYELNEKEQGLFGLQLPHHAHLDCFKLYRYIHIITHHQLRVVSNCEHEFLNTSKMERFCFNPYHYELIVTPEYPRVFVPLSASVRPDINRRLDANKTFVNGVPNLLVTDILPAIDGGQRPSQPFLPHSTTTNNNDKAGIGGSNCDRTVIPMNSTLNLQCYERNIPPEDAPNEEYPSYSGLSMTSSPLICSPANSLNTNEASPQGYLSEDMEMDVPTSDSVPRLRQDPSTVDESNSGERMDVSSGGAPMLPELTHFEQILNKYSNQYPHGLNRTDNNNTEEMQVSDSSSINGGFITPGHLDVVSVEYTEAVFWCTVAYYEGRHRIGTPYLATRKSIIVDGFTSPSDEYRLCIGHIENVNRTKDAIDVRSAIGTGIRLYDLGGDVYFENLSGYPIFIQIPMVTHEANHVPGTVYKLPTACNLKVFTMNSFRDVLVKALREGYDSILQLKRLCTLRLSFIKGWGRSYRRQYVVDTPCWLEIHLNGPIDWLDSILGLMGPSPNRATSYT